MNEIKTLSIVISFFAIGANAFGQDPSATDVIKKVKAAYHALETYRAQGTIDVDISVGGTSTQMETTFAILLKKPNQYLISWTQSNGATPGMEQSGAVWSNGMQPYLYMEIMKAYSKIEGDMMALSAATGISGGAAHTVPSIFLGVFPGQPDPFSRLTNPTLEKTEKVGDVDCYVISGASVISKKETFWISKTSHLIQQYRRSFEPPVGGMRFPNTSEMSESEIEEAIEALGQEVTEESKKKMKQLMEAARSTLKDSDLKGYSEERHFTISSPDLKASDFDYLVPVGVILKESLFSQMLE